MYQEIRPGKIWLDDNNKRIQAHGGSILYAWNLVDDTALGVENLAKGGLLRRDMTPKPAFEQLKKLILSEWRTSAETVYDSTSHNYVRGFCGTYDVTVELPDGRTFETTEKIVAGRRNEAEIIINPGE